MTYSCTKIHFKDTNYGININVQGMRIEKEAIKAYTLSHFMLVFG